ncbi:50S ribosomal protein L23 [bacterium endosymbiont of Bathymodiolus sp. 5 South]|jgi:large subunit ribosomal protein L23|uniref:50S ribosomal protein L23 n=1 Tax=bacterium endosymbiont of Bathymodiolus sp. 5 South TaxID=1181670 RepID=UPI0010B950C3|nr:50S ribosomal protein L23 [bacterium endosymbiont of Bathymodiolus sp. 5 South]VVH59812.1 LSU ribosomal protein L23p (L23Ae) [uncultured Gammaproteobacteria bacterium]SHN89595.1 LSU ribosomal protein L23p (L23Ae) [bacterium endosymbiont of Bathymodiolus sp. 5 South]SSC08604.1 LSU ribosomal protein L23p (L23Ae) [bacterium endosymbiont of Bathymodiolus sp. 5 South]VVH61913.1 LSU ribosomal protein L23p (L23Ae) [uncultured Gammaproteobacteria bacterium]VVM23812.1 LSU ribosomal protein L23p (L23
MNQEKILKTLLAPIVSEKASILSAQNQYAFKVRVDSNKKEIKAAIESLFGVTVENVTTSIVKGKKKVFKGKIGRRVNWKKAMVKVSEGQMIDVTAS